MRCDLAPTYDREHISICVVDDDPLIADSLSQILAMEGFRVTAFTNPLHALDSIRSPHAASPHLLISDVMMPELSGIELARLVQSSACGCRVLLFSAALDELLRDAGPAGVEFRLLAKPLRPDTLLYEIDNILALDSATAWSGVT